MKTRSFELLTPEMVKLDFELADAGSRIGAFLIDLTLIVLAVAIAFVLVWTSFTVLGLSPSWIVVVVLLLFFAIRNFYFIAFELAWRGTTPGKRASRLRVVAADGGPLTPGLIFARNLTREVEVFLPAIAITNPGLLVRDAPDWIMVATVTWALAIALLPLTNRTRSRLGDLVAGTVVVAEPHDVLLDDLASVTLTSQASETSFRFTDEQLDIYGAYELQVLEDIFRRQPLKGDSELMDLICAKVIKKIAWPRSPSDVPSEAFLRSFYRSQRRRLEQRMLLGDRRERKVR